MARTAVRASPCALPRATGVDGKPEDRSSESVASAPSCPKGHAHCPACATSKPLTDFPRSRAQRNGRGVYCKPCHNRKSRETRDRLYGGGREYHLRRRYGLTGVQYQALVDAQGGLCALCRERPPQHVDHDHLTGEVRGVLFSCCNQGLGNFRDSAETLRAAAAYLERTTVQRRRVELGVYRLTWPAAPVARSTADLAAVLRARGTR